jgi:DNA mismatch endonuclease Vsr
LADIVTKAGRSRIMSRVKSRNTGPERVVRTICARMGVRYRLHRRDLPGSPDLVFGARKLVIFVHGCYSSAPAVLRPASAQSSPSKRIAQITGLLCLLSASLRLRPSCRTGLNSGEPA